MNKEIKGTIEYTIKITEEGFGVDYIPTLETNIASLLIAGNITQIGSNNLKGHKKILKGDKKKEVHEALQKMIRAKFTLDNMTADLINALLMQKNDSE